MEDKELLKEARTLFNNLKIDPSSVLFSEERIDNRLLKKLKNSKYLKDAQLLKHINLADNKDFLEAINSVLSSGCFLLPQGKPTVF